MISFKDFRLAPINRDATLAEKLADVPEGTYESFESQMEEISSQDLATVLPNERYSAIEEQFNIMRVEPDIRKFHDYTQNWFGKPTAETVMLLSRFGYVESGVLTPGKIEDVDQIKALIETQQITLPEDIAVDDLKGLEWNERLVLQIGRARDNGR